MLRFQTVSLLLSSRSAARSWRGSFYNHLEENWAFIRGDAAPSVNGGSSEPPFHLAARSDPPERRIQPGGHKVCHRQRGGTAQMNCIIV
ncbi:hypothetical protein BC938DRAFT_478817 [Jimgerdemannia flammicorona]|uniref:Uncharacterized protein n=1 Tax=Jimgerdemannia flammicorona TaxID=994334 RepID=A0A433QM79_9FUNG|nr:hypothetical protein BC938DRAFT_478817 [Jimgerdemannia flammicorona]